MCERFRHSATGSGAATYRRDMTILLTEGPAEPESPSPDRHVLTAAEFDVVWEWLGLGPTPVVLRLDSPGRTRTERRRIEADGWQALRDRGLAGPGGPDPELTRLLHLLARPVVALELRGWWGRSVRAVAAGRPESGALAVRQDGSVTLQAAGSLPRALLGVLPAAGAGPGRAVTLPTPALTAAMRAAGEGTPGRADPGPGPRGLPDLPDAAPPGRTTRPPGSAEGRLRAALQAVDVAADEAALLARMLGAAERRAQLVALTGDRWGGSTRCGAVLGVLDGARGRYLLTRSTGEDGVDWSTVAPVDDRRLRHRLADLLTGALPADLTPSSALPA